ncbi:MAG: hypothetical protein DI629_09045 [Mesorhizobium amorphae]|nr:MAG: hypothetical protein DI629_09045 [Mesorhizobium amorphae]
MHAKSAAMALGALICGFPATGALADLRYRADQTPGGVRYLIVEGGFEHGDDLSEFRAAVRANDPTIIGFNSPGGNIIKAMELGRLIRVFGLNTLQSRSLECASACSLAFMGGVSRSAEPGSIGVHKSSFSGDTPIASHDAVSAVQAITAEIVTYMVEMGIDPSILQLSLRYDSDDIRYLSKSEMQQYRVTTAGSAPQGQVASAPPAETQAPVEETVSEHRAGRVRHPRGEAPLMAEAQEKAGELGRVANGTPVTIVADAHQWYRVRGSGIDGFMHHSWVMVEGYAARRFDSRYIQVKSYGSLAEARSYVRSSPLPLSIHLSTNGWYAVTLKDAYPGQAARELAKTLKAQGRVPDDAFATYGNTYVREVPR